MIAVLLLALVACHTGKGETDTSVVDTDTDVVDTDTDTDDTDTDVVDTDTDTDTDVLTMTVSITSPATGSSYTAGDVVPLAASATFSDGSSPDVTYLWTSSITGTIGEGATLDWATTDLDVGTATITVHAESGELYDQTAVDVTVNEAHVGSHVLYDGGYGVPTGETWRDLDVMDDGRVIGGTPHGLVVFDGATTVVDGLIAGLATDDVYATEQMSDGVVWVGYSELTGLDGQQMTLAADGTPTITFGMNIDRTGEIREFHRFFEEPDIVTASGTDSDRDVWIGTNEGECLYDRDLDVWLEHRHPTHPHLLTLGVTVTSDGTIWNGDDYQLSRWTYLDDGNYYNTGALVDYGTVWSAPVLGTDPISVQDLASDGTTVYVASGLYGFAVIDASDPSRLGDATFPADGVITAAYAVGVGLDGTVWIGASDGLYTYDPTTAAVERYGADWLSSQVQQIAVDPATGDVWLATTDGLYDITP